jgi:hypothetical protein
VTIEVPANRSVTDTGVDVRVEESIYILATGTIQVFSGVAASTVDANGQPARYAGCELQQYCGTLLASLQPTRGWVRAGTEASFSFRAQGRLYLRTNVADPSSASGAFTVKIRAGPSNLVGSPAPSVAGISRDGVLPGGGGGSASSLSAPPLDMAIAAGLAGLGALVAPFLVGRLRSRRGGPPPPEATPTA